MSWVVEGEVDDECDVPLLEGLEDEGGGGLTVIEERDLELHARRR